jgi:hypothetical protein
MSHHSKGGKVFELLTPFRQIVLSKRADIEFQIKNAAIIQGEG